jgi:hypothetical protein
MTVLRPRVPPAMKRRAAAKSNSGVAAFAVLVGGAFFSIPFVAHFMKVRVISKWSLVSGG